MPNLSRLNKTLALLNERNNVSTQRIRYNGIELSPRPFVKDLGINDGYKATYAIRDGIKRWEIRAYDDNLTGITLDTAFNDFDFGRWQISEDDGSTWLNCFLDEPPLRGPGVYKIKIGRGFTDANLTIKYQIGQGTFTTVEGNPVETTNNGAIYASVSQGRNRSQLQQNPGNSPAQIYLEGFYTNASGEPTKAPIDLPLQRPWPATLTVGNAATMNGTFTPVVLSENAWSAMESMRGSTCQGFFTTTGSGQAVASS